MRGAFPRTRILLLLALPSTPAWAHSPGAFVVSVGIVGLLAAAVPLGVKWLILKLTGWKTLGTGPLVVVGIAELVGLAPLSVALIATDGTMFGLGLGFVGFTAVATLFNAALFVTPTKLRNRLGRGLALGMVTPLGATLSWILLLQPVYVSLGG